MTYGRNHKAWNVPRFGTPVKETCEEEKVLKATFIVRLNSALSGLILHSCPACLQEALPDQRSQGWPLRAGPWVTPRAPPAQLLWTSALPCPAQLSLAQISPGKGESPSGATQSTAACWREGNLLAPLPQCKILSRQGFLQQKCSWAELGFELQLSREISHTHTHKCKFSPHGHRQGPALPDP